MHSSNILIHPKYCTTISLVFVYGMLLTLLVIGMTPDYHSVCRAVSSVEAGENEKGAAAVAFAEAGRQPAEE
jgi:hypothetical protein